MTASPTFPEDISTEPGLDVDTLKNLRPLADMSGIWRGRRGLDEPFHHTARKGPTKIGESTPNLLART